MASGFHAFLFVFACIVSGRVWAADCTKEEIVQCAGEGDLMKILQSVMTGGDNLDPSAVTSLCGLLKCAGNLQCDLPKEMQSTEMEQMKSMCSEDGCSFQSFTKCLGGIQLTDLTKQLPEEEEKKLCSSIDCLKKMLPTCGEEMKQSVEGAVMSLEGRCGGCNMMEVTKCMSMTTAGKPTEDSCKKAAEVAVCLKPYQSKCEGEMKKSIDEAIGYPKCCSGLLEGLKCYPNEALMENGGFNMDMCDDKEKVYTCIMAVDLQCTGSMKAEADKVKSSLKGEIEECKAKGYNVTISLASGKPLTESGKDPKDVAVSVQPTLAVLVGLTVALLAFWF